MLVISLCDYSGVMVAPWVAAGYSALLVDPRHDGDRTAGGVRRLGLTVDAAMPVLADLCASLDVRAVFSFPPCTDLAACGARWFARKYAADALFQARALAVVEQCRTVGRMSRAPWFVENPVGVVGSLLGPPSHTFHPWHYTALEPDDNYTKLTCLWAGGGFVMPAPCVDETLPPPDPYRIWFAPDSKGRADRKSVTPNGFAQAVYLANDG